MLKFPHSVPIRRETVRRTELAGMAAGAGVLAAIFFAAPGGAADVTRSPVVVAEWRLDESPGASKMVDSSSSVVSHNGSISSDVIVGVAGADAIPGTAYKFTGSRAIVRVPTAPDLNPGSQPLTISAYLKVPASLSAGDYNVIQKGPADTAGGAYKLEIAGNARSNLFGYPDCAFNFSSGLKNRVYGPKPINDGAWHLVRCRLTATRAYVTVDGVAGTKVSRVAGRISNNVDVTLGGKPNYTHYFYGKADHVSITIG